MKTIKSIVLVFAIAFSSVLSASTNPVTEAPTSSDEKVITQEVSKLLQDPSFDVDHDMKAQVTITINKDNEIVVLSVDTKDESIESYIKARLNYNQLPSALTANAKTFIVPVTLKTELY